eukprot:3365666-Rhodomonas_salina.2
MVLTVLVGVKREFSSMPVAGDDAVTELLVRCLGVSMVELAVTISCSSAKIVSDPGWKGGGVHGTFFCRTIMVPFTSSPPSQVFSELQVLGTEFRARCRFIATYCRIARSGTNLSYFHTEDSKFDCSNLNLYGRGPTPYCNFVPTVRSNFIFICHVIKKMQSRDVTKQTRWVLLATLRAPAEVPAAISAQ